MVRLNKTALTTIAGIIIGAVIVTTLVIVNSNGEHPVPEATPQPGSSGNKNATATVIPAPVSQINGDGRFVLTPETAISVTTAESTAEGTTEGTVANAAETSADVNPASTVATYLAEQLRIATGLPLPIAEAGTITIGLEAGHPAEGYELSVTTAGIRIVATDAAGLFWGVQSLRQLLPVEIDRGSTTADIAPDTSPEAAPEATRGATRGAASEWSVAATTIRDHPRFAYRGAMLDVARHFFSVGEVKKYIEDIAMLKFNILHLHLTDDQGWRLQIDGWPRLTEYGSTTQVGGGGGGFYTKVDYREIVAYATSRHITVVPEIDMPGHTNAALASYPELNCDGKSPELYEGIEVGFSSLCITNERTYEFVEDVISELVDLTPGPWIHIGGDESLATTEADFLTFVNRVSAIVSAHGKTVIGWHEMGRSTQLPAGTIGEYWSYTTPQEGAAAESQNFVDNGGQLIMAPADVAYLDMKYDSASPLGLVWANGPTTVTESYQWDPADILPGVDDESILGVEAPIWTETIVTMTDLQTMAFPRIASIAEIAWSPRAERNFSEFAVRLAKLAQRLDSLGISYYRAPDVPWMPSK